MFVLKLSGIKILLRAIHINIILQCYIVELFMESVNTIIGSLSRTSFVIKNPFTRNKLIQFGAKAFFLLSTFLMSTKHEASRYHF